MDTPQIAPGDTLAPSPDPPPAPDYYAALSPRHQRFADLVARGVSQSQAYIAAGYAPDEGHASRLAANGMMAAAIDQLRADLSARAAITREEYIAELKRDRDYDPLLAYEDGSFRVKPLSEWPEDLRKCLTGMEIHERETEFGTTRTVKLRFISREKVKELLGRALGFFEQESRGSQFILIIQPPPGADEPRSVGQEIPLAPGVTLLPPPDATR